MLKILNIIKIYLILNIYAQTCYFNFINGSIYNDITK
jgi:hypothetical protein